MVLIFFHASVCTSVPCYISFPLPFCSTWCMIWVRQLQILKLLSRVQQSQCTLLRISVNTEQTSFVHWCTTWMDTGPGHSVVAVMATLWLVICLTNITTCPVQVLGVDMLTVLLHRHGTGDSVPTIFHTMEMSWQSAISLYQWQRETKDHATSLHPLYWCIPIQQYG